MKTYTNLEVIHGSKDTHAYEHINNNRTDNNNNIYNYNNCKNEKEKNLTMNHREWQNKKQQNQQQAKLSGGKIHTQKEKNNKD